MLFKICAWSWLVRLISFFFCFSVVFPKERKRHFAPVHQKWWKYWRLNSIWVFQGTSIITQSCFAPCEGIQGSLGFWTPRHGFRIPGTGFQIFFSGTWIPVVSGIPDSKAQDFGFNRQTFPRFWIPHTKISKIPDSTCKNISRFRIPHAKISKIPDSTRKTFQDSRFHKQNFPRFWNPYSLTWGDRFLLDYNCLMEGSKLKPRQSVILLFVCFLGDFCGS